MSARNQIDFHEIPTQQIAMHTRLLNWGQWCKGRGFAEVSPMFRMYRSTDVWTSEAGLYSIPVDTQDAAKVAKGVLALPDLHRQSLGWYYVKHVSPKKACAALATNMAGLQRFVLDARTMLINRRI